MAPTRICSILNCDKTSAHRGWCVAHYNRWQRHGDPEAGGPLRLTKVLRCAIPECAAKPYAHGWCQAHYWRWKRNGDPLAGATTPGDVHTYFRDVVVPHDSDECLIWPFHRNAGGYGQLWHEGRLHLVSRLICEIGNGPPPTSEYQAAHSCGRGADGCVTRKHTSWKTPADNTADRITHGTANRGERHNWSKLTEAEVKAIRLMIGTTNRTAIARRFNVTPAAIWHIERGDSWAWLE